MRPAWSALWAPRVPAALEFDAGFGPRPRPFAAIAARQGACIRWSEKRLDRLYFLTYTNKTRNCPETRNRRALA